MTEQRTANVAARPLVAGPKTMRVKARVCGLISILWLSITVPTIWTYLEMGIPETYGPGDYVCGTLVAMQGMWWTLALVLAFVEKPRTLEH